MQESATDKVCRSRIVRKPARIRKIDDGAAMSDDVPPAPRADFRSRFKLRAAAESDRKVAPIRQVGQGWEVARTSRWLESIRPTHRA